MSLEYELSTFAQKPVQPGETLAGSPVAVSAAELHRLLHLTEQDLRSVADLSRWARVLVLLGRDLERVRAHIDMRLADLILEGGTPPSILTDHEPPPAFLRMQAD